MAHVAGGSLYVREAGSGPPVLLIHGTSLDADSWAGIFDDLAADHRVVAYDRRGHSRSRAAGASCDWDRHTDDAVAVLEAHGLAPATVVGWSAGGIAAMKLAIDHPRLVASLVLAEPVYDVMRNLTGAYARMLMTCWALIAARRQASAHERFIRFVSRREGLPSAWDDPAFPASSAEACRANAGAFAVETGPRSRLTMPSAGDAARIAAPTTVVLGGRSDRWFAKMATSVARAIPEATLERLPEANHMFGFTDPHGVAAAIRAAVPAGHRTTA